MLPYSFEEIYESINNFSTTERLALFDIFLIKPNKTAGTLWYEFPFHNLILHSLDSRLPGLKSQTAFQKHFKSVQSLLFLI
jgi:hypothetical protein